MGFFSRLKINTMNSFIDDIIIKMSSSPSLIGTSYKEISYKDVVNYIESRKCNILSSSNKGDHVWIEFVSDIKGNNYTVWLGKTFEGDGSVITVPPK